MSQLGFRFTPFTNESVTAQWSAKDMHSRSRSVSGPEMYAGKRTKEEEVQRAIDSETDANTEFNAAKLSANLRPRSTSLDKGGRKKKKSSKEEKARRRAFADQARRERRRNAGLDSDTTQGEDSDSEYVTGHGNAKPRQMNGTFNENTSKRGRKHSASTSANMPPTHPYASPNGYSYAPYGPSHSQSPYAANGYGPSYLSPNLFASTNPSIDPEEMARRKLESNPLPGLPQTLPRAHRSQAPPPQPSNSLPGGYAPAREKSKSKHAKSASTGTLPSHVRRSIFRIHFNLLRDYLLGAKYVLDRLPRRIHLHKCMLHLYLPSRLKVDVTRIEIGVGTEIGTMQDGKIEVIVGVEQDGIRPRES
ncbi:hypothetical protein B0J17DRAFT_166706 [Rhizoctonia solani]|nr:hypothetical protein B0J17DRAFT_166706 [Rhizoctonia solani]